MALQERIIACQSGQVIHRYLCHYRPKAAGADKLSESLLRFKNGYSLDLQAWTECAQSALASELTPGTLIVRALAHHELMIVNPPFAPLDILAARLASQCTGQYLPQCLSKLRLTKPMKLLTRSERKKELREVYRVLNKRFFTNRTAILVVDDILTSGSTASAIVDALNEVNEAISISVFTLAYTEKYLPLNAELTLKSFTYQWDRVSGWAFAEDSGVPYGTLVALKQKIQEDSF